MILQSPFLIYVLMCFDLIMAVEEYKRVPVYQRLLKEKIYYTTAKAHCRLTEMYRDGYT